MRVIGIFILGLLVLGLIALIVWREADRRADAREMARLAGVQPDKPKRFDPAMVADLPEPARRFFTFAIAEGTPLNTVARIEMQGRFSLGNKASPEYMQMRATQVLAAPEGFVWAMRGGAGAMRLAGSDSGRWTRFWLAGLVPVARLGGDPDHARAAFGRYVAEAVFWTPAAVLPSDHVSWAAVSTDTARMTMRKGALSQSVDVQVNAEGQPVQVSFDRWSDANPEKRYQFQRFGGYLSEFRDFGGFRLPTRVEAGNFFDTEDYFPFFIVDVTEVSFPRAFRL